MAFDKTLPSNSTKIRNYPTVLTDNFSAIEEGEITLKHWQVNFIERNAVPGAPPPANDPTRADDTMIVFSKQDGAGETELFLMDDQNPANIIQISEDGSLGSATTTLSILNIKFSTETATYKSDNFVAYWGLGNGATGAISSGTGGITGTRTAQGEYTISFTVAQATANYGAHITVQSSSNPRFATYHTSTINDFKIIIFDEGGGKQDENFTVSIYGERP